MFNTERERQVIQLLRELSQSKDESAYKREWVFAGVEVEPYGTNCMACGAFMCNVVHVYNSKSGELCLLGTDCYDAHARHALGLPSRTASLGSRFRDVVAYLYNDHPPKALKGKSWKTWLTSSDGAADLPSGVQAGVWQLKKAGHIEDPEVLFACIEYHDTKRFLPADVLLGRELAAKLYRTNPRREISFRKAQEILGLRRPTVEMAADVISGKLSLRTSRPARRAPRTGPKRRSETVRSILRAHISESGAGLDPTVVCAEFGTAQGRVMTPDTRLDRGEALRLYWFLKRLTTR